MEETKKINPLGSSPVGGLMLKFAIPSIIGMLVSALYNIVDQLFALNAQNPENRTPLVSGTFEKFAFVDGTLAVYMELTYYVFDVENYEYPPAAIVGSYDAWRAYMEPFYHRYTIPEFEEACPQFQDCEWTVIREKTPRR